MRRWLTILRFVGIALTIVLWIISYPTVLGYGSTPMVIQGIPPPPVFKTSYTNAMTKGKTITARYDHANLAYDIILWKGSVHLQRRADVENLGVDEGLHVSRSYWVMETNREDHWSGQELYFSGTRWHCLGAAWVNYPITWGRAPSGSLTAIALPLWMVILALLFPTIYRLFVKKRNEHRRGFEVM
jgi:hypothetical protein